MLRARSGDALLHRTARAAVLDGHARVFFRGTPYPTLARRAGGCVAGLLARPGPAAMRALRRHEGRCCRLVPVRVRTARGAVRAVAFAVPGRMAAPDAPWFPAAPSPRAGAARS